MNPAACAVFHTDAACVGQPLLTVERGSAVSHALHDAMDTGHGETRMERDGREYQFDMTRIQADGEVVGAVLLTFDVTEQAYAERNRREFTANVSHELKTPLQGIIGSAELLENGMVRPDDVPHAGHRQRCFRHGRQRTGCGKGFHHGPDDAGLPAQSPDGCHLPAAGPFRPGPGRPPEAHPPLRMGCICYYGRCGLRSLWAAVLRSHQKKHLPPFSPISSF